MSDRGRIGLNSRASGDGFSMQKMTAIENLRQAAPRKVPRAF